LALDFSCTFEDNEQVQLLAGEWPKTSGVERMARRPHVAGGAIRAEKLAVLPFLSRAAPG